MDMEGTIFYLPPEAGPTRHTVKCGDKTLNPMGVKRTGSVLSQHTYNKLRTETHSASLLPSPREPG